MPLTLAISTYKKKTKQGEGTVEDHVLFAEVTQLALRSFSVSIMEMEARYIVRA